MFKRFSVSEYFASAFLCIGAIGIATTKAFLFTSPKIFYIVFFISLITLALLLLRKKTNFIKNILILTLPTQIILLLTNNLTHKLHWIFDVMTGTWLLLLVFVIIRKWHHKHSADKINVQKPTKKYTIPTIIFLLIIILTHFVFGFYHLGKAAYVDERLWTYSNEKRVEKYWNNILEMDWKNTRPSDKPGVTLAFISGPSLLFTTPSDFKEKITDKNEFEKTLFDMRLPILIFSTLALLVFYHILSTLFNTKIGLISTAFIGLSPILLGVSRIINPDALLWIFMPLALLTYFLQIKTKDVRWTYTTGILLGFGLLTKYITNLLFPFFFVLLFTYPFFFDYTKQKLRAYIRLSLSQLGIITLIALSVFYIFYPGTWVKMDRLLLGTIWSQPFKPVWIVFALIIFAFVFDYFFNKSSVTLWLANALQKAKRVFILIIPIIFTISILAVFYFAYDKTGTIDFEKILLSPKTSFSTNGDATFLDAFITSFYPIVFGIIPISIIGIFSALFFISKKHTTLQLRTHSTIIYNLLLFIIIFYIGSLFSSVMPTVRYQIIIYPFIFVISGYGWYYLLHKFFKNTSTPFYILLATIMLGNIYFLYSIKPFYFSFNSPFLPKQHLINPKDMGDGNYEVAQYLNTLPNAKNLNIWSDKRGVCTFFVGDCVSVIRKKDFIENGPHYDYFVISKGREARTVDLSRGYSQMREDYPVRLDLLYTANPQTIYELNPGNRSVNYIKVIPEENIHVWRGQ